MFARLYVTLSFLWFGLITGLNALTGESLLNHGHNRGLTMVWSEVEQSVAWDKTVLFYFKCLLINTRVSLRDETVMWQIHHDLFHLAGWTYLNYPFICSCLCCQAVFSHMKTVLCLNHDFITFYINFYQIILVYNPPHTWGTQDPC